MSTPPALNGAPKSAILLDPSNVHLNGAGPYSNGPSRSGSSVSLQKIQNLPGYKTPVFTGKDEQRQQVMGRVASKGFIPKDLVSLEVNWFYSNLGVDDSYFQSETVDVITDHVLALYGAKLLAFTKHNPDKLVIDLEKITEDRAVFIHTSPPGVTSHEGPGATCERRIDGFLDNSTRDQAYRLETYRSAGSISATASQQLRCYFVSKCRWVSPPAPSTSRLPRTTPVLSSEATPKKKTDIRSVSDRVFLERASENTLEIYQKVMWNVEGRYGPVIELFEVEGTSERRLVLGYKMGTTRHIFSALSDLYHFYGLYSARKYVEQFSNGITIISLYLNPLPGNPKPMPPIDHSVVQIMKEASLLYCLPDNPFFGSTRSAGTSAADSAEGANAGGHAVQEATYAYAGWLFCQHFCNRLGPSYLALKNMLDESDPAQADVLNAIKMRFRQETFTRENIQEVIVAYPQIIRWLYVHFAEVHYPSARNQDIQPSLSYIRLKTEPPLNDEELYDRIRKTVNNKHELQVFESFLVFNKHVLRTNFYTPTKVAVSFRLNPNFLPESEYPKRPFGMFFVIGSEFRGFHIRFRDVARGGIRLVNSRGRENYSINQRSLFDENYALAATQDLKNKDLGEGGSKGTILPSLGSNPVLCFEKYIDAMLDLLIPGETPGIKTPIVDHYGKPELLFFGPDEGTADLMDWAALHARTRGASWWKSLTTGKNAEFLGGIPHDAYGMTSLSLRQYIIGIYNKLGLKEKDITKVQTGGPDGDLGSNEILLGSEKTIAVIDGSGVLYDPVGIDRVELVRLAKARVMISKFDRSRLGKDGYIVLIGEQDVKLPSGEVVADGTDFRNTAHMRFKADIFVPCGGRPEAINISNVASLVDSEGKPHYKFIVEGANLFITQQARLYLEKRKVILFKDSSANKGGVFCSSLDVLAGLSLTDKEHTNLMTFPGQSPPVFYQSYVKDIQAKIRDNAALEFNCIWKEHARLGGAKSRALLSDELSTKINDLQTELESSDLFEDLHTRRAVLSQAIPQTLLHEIGLDVLMKRLPEPYQRALFSAYFASQFIYHYGIDATAVNFFQFSKSFASLGV